MADLNVSFIQRFHCTQGRGPLYSGRDGWSQCVLYSEGSTVHKEEDLSIMDEMAGPNVSEVPLYIRKRTASL